MSERKSFNVHSLSLYSKGNFIAKDGGSLFALRNKIDLSHLITHRQTTFPHANKKGTTVNNHDPILF